MKQLLSFALSVVSGAAVATALVVLLRTSAPRRQLHAYGVALFLAAALYVGFTLFNGAYDRIPAELMGVGIFTTFVWLAIQRWPRLLAIGWALHVVWDLALHPVPVEVGVPWWYPPLCLGFDLVIAARVWRLAPRVAGGTP